MSKIAIIGDMHFGVKGGNQAFLDFQFYWLEEALKRIQAEGITRIIQTGDMFDVRPYMKFNVMHVMITKFKPLLKKYGIKNFIVYAGNHDLFYRDSNDIASIDILNLLNSDDESIFWIIKDTVETWQDVDGATFAFVPWLNKNNQAELLSQIPPKTDYVFGHFEMVGMPMVPGGASCEHGLQIQSFKKHKRVISGHFHTISTHMNCTMVGTPYHLNWGDTLDGTNRGFWVLDTKKDTLTLHKNEDHMTLFSVIEYDPKESYDEKFFAPYAGTLVKVLVKEKGDTKHYKKFSELLSKAELIDYKIIDTTMVQIEKVEISEEVLTLDTLSAMKAYIDAQDVVESSEKDSLKKLAGDIYLEVLNGTT